MKLLIVDDSKAMCAIVRREINKLKGYSFILTIAENGKDALQIVDDWQPDIVLTDWHMPFMSGIELLSLIKQREQPIKVAFVTTEKNSQRIKQPLYQPTTKR